jgi:glucose/arabinose dehydrogenase
VSTLASGLSNPTAITVGPDGNLVVAESGKSRIIRVSAANGTFTVVAGTGTAGNADGPAATATFTNPYGIAAAPDGTIYVAQYNGTIRKISAGGTVSTLAGSPGQSAVVDGVGSAARFANPYGMILDAQGNLLVGEYFGGGIRKVTPDGTVTTWVGGLGGFADGQGAAARFNRPCHFGRDAAGNIYVADYYNDSIRKVTPAGLVTTLVGSPVLRGCRAGALPGSIYRPWGIAARPNGDVLVVSEAAIMAITAP